MQLYELVIIAVSLSMDAFAVSICKGLSTARPRLRHCLVCGGWFGSFQALMPMAGWLLGVRFQALIASVDHWIAFFLLSLILLLSLFLFLILFLLPLVILEHAVEKTGYFLFTPGFYILFK